MGGRRGFTHGNIQPTPGNMSPDSYTASLRRAIQAYDGLLLELRRDMGQQDCARVDDHLARIRRILPAGVLEHQHGMDQDIDDTSQRTSTSPPEEQNYYQPHSLQSRPLRVLRPDQRSGKRGSIESIRDTTT